MTTLTCINCPIGCQLTVTEGRAGRNLRIEGNLCKRGITYAQAELTVTPPAP